jgi:hypothetical protein
VHFIEQGKVNMLDSDLCLEVSGEFPGYLPGYPVLAEGCLNKNIQPDDQEEKGQEKPFQYFFKSPQRQLFKV